MLKAGKFMVRLSPRDLFYVRSLIFLVPQFLSAIQRGFNVGWELEICFFNSTLFSVYAHMCTRVWMLVHHGMWMPVQAFSGVSSLSTTEVVEIQTKAGRLGSQHSPHHPIAPQAPKVREDKAGSEYEGRGSERQWLTRTRPPGGKRGAVLVLLKGSV